MEVLYPHCAGLDVHKDTVVACVRHMAGATVRREVRTFTTLTKDLLALADWLSAEGCSLVVMEATGIYWKPVWHVLDDGGFELLLANAAHVKNVPGRKTDVNDATWLADLAAHGLVRGSVVPDTAPQEQRALLRTRRQLVRERTSHVQRLQAVLEDCNIKLGSVLSDIMGQSGQAIIRALIAGDDDPVKLAELAHRRIKAAPDTLIEALRGRVTRHHRFLLELHMKHIGTLDGAIASIDEEVARRDEPFREALWRLITIPGVGPLTAREILAESGIDMSRFPTSGQLVSWAGLCPRNDESAGRRRSNRMRKGAQWLKATLVQCAWAAIKKKDSYLRAQFYRLRARRGAKKAICAVASSILVAIYHMLRDGTCYQDPGADYFDRNTKDKLAKRLRIRLENLGYDVNLAPKAAA
jgi:transposase